MCVCVKPRHAMTIARPDLAVKRHGMWRPETDVQTWLWWHVKAWDWRPKNAFAMIRNLVARARDPQWEELWGYGKKPKRMHRIHCIHYYRIQYTRQARNI